MLSFIHYQKTTNFAMDDTKSKIQESKETTTPQEPKEATTQEPTVQTVSTQRKDVYKLLEDPEHLKEGERILSEFNAHQLGSIAYQDLCRGVNSNPNYMPVDDWMIRHHVGVDTIYSIVAVQQAYRKSNNIEVNTFSKALSDMYKRSHMSRKVDGMISCLKEDTKLCDHLQTLDKSLWSLRQAVQSKSKEESEKLILQVSTEVNGISSNIRHILETYMNKHLNFLSKDLIKLFVKVGTRVLCSDEMFCAKVQTFHPEFMVENYGGNNWLLLHFVLVTPQPKRLSKWEAETEAYYKGIDKNYEDIYAERRNGQEVNQTEKGKEGNGDKNDKKEKSERDGTAEELCRE